MFDRRLAPLLGRRNKRLWCRVPENPRRPTRRLLAATGTLQLLGVYGRGFYALPAAGEDVLPGQARCFVRKSSKNDGHPTFEQADDNLPAFC